MQDLSPTAAVQLTVEDHVAVLSLNRPDSFNAINLEVASTLRDTVNALAAREDVRVLLLRSEGRAFSSGGDISEFQRYADDLPTFIARMIDTFHEMVLAMARMPQVIVSCVQGAAAGGGMSLALAADVVLAGRRGAQFVVAYPQLGTSTDGGLSYRFLQAMSPALAMAAMTLGGRYSAEDAQRMGLVHTVVDDDALSQTAAETAHQLARLAPQAVRELRRLCNASSIAALQAQLDRERESFLRCAATQDFATRVKAFAERAGKR